MGIENCTAGRWAVEHWGKGESQIVSLVDGRKSLICAGVLDTDAHLMAASKELYEALDELRHVGSNLLDRKKARQKADAALAAARGQS